MGFFQGTQNKFEIAVVNGPSVFKPLKVYGTHLSPIPPIIMFKFCISFLFSFLFSFYTKLPNFVTIFVPTFLASFSTYPVTLKFYLQLQDQYLISLQYMFTLYSSNFANNLFAYGSKYKAPDSSRYLNGLLNIDKRYRETWCLERVTLYYYPS